MPGRCPGYGTLNVLWGGRQSAGIVWNRIRVGLCRNYT